MPRDPYYPEYRPNPNPRYGSFDRPYDPEYDARNYRAQERERERHNEIRTREREQALREREERMGDGFNHSRGEFGHREELSPYAARGGGAMPERRRERRLKKGKKKKRERREREKRGKGSKGMKPLVEYEDVSSDSEIFGSDAGADAGGLSISDSPVRTRASPHGRKRHPSHSPPSHKQNKRHKDLGRYSDNAVVVDHDDSPPPRMPKDRGRRNTKGNALPGKVFPNMDAPKAYVGDNRFRGRGDSSGPSPKRGRNREPSPPFKSRRSPSPIRGIRRPASPFSTNRWVVWLFCGLFC